MKITLDWLESLKACEIERKLFSEVFGNSLELPTEENAQHELAVLLHENKFDRVWCLSHLMREEQRDKYFDVPTSTEDFRTWNIARWKTVIEILANMEQS
jgi:hypothetical protein